MIQDSPQNTAMAHNVLHIVGHGCILWATDAFCGPQLHFVGHSPSFNLYGGLGLSLQLLRCEITKRSEIPNMHTLALGFFADPSVLLVQKLQNFSPLNFFN